MYVSVAHFCTPILHYTWISYMQVAIDSLVYADRVVDGLALDCLRSSCIVQNRSGSYAMLVR